MLEDLTERCDGLVAIAAAVVHQDDVAGPGVLDDVRDEGVDAGTSLLVGTRTEPVLEAATRLLEDGGAYAAMARRANPFGDGKAAARIVGAIRQRSNA